MSNIKINKKYWSPIVNVISSIENLCIKNNYKNILEIGPGEIPFNLANTYIDFNNKPVLEKEKTYIKLDIDVNRLPFQDKSLDFIYTRHTLEDIQNPDFAMSEIIRVSKSGYVETPSPLIEITKGVDCFYKSNFYAGYIHHRYIIWSDIENCEIYFLPKYNTIIDNYINLNNKNIEDLYKDPIYWNNYFIWQNKTPKIIIYKNGINLGVNNNLIDDYIQIINIAINKSIYNTNFFIKNIN